MQLYEFDDNPKRRVFLDDLFSFMQRRGEWGSAERAPGRSCSSSHFTRHANQPPARHGQAGAGHVRAVQQGGGARRPVGGHSQESLAGNHKRSETADLDNLGRLHTAHPVHAIFGESATILISYYKFASKTEFPQYPYECREKNFSKPSELQAVVEGHRREGRRGCEEPPYSQFLPLPPTSFPSFLPQFPLLPPPLRPSPPGEPQHSPGLPHPALNPLDVTRLTLMKMMGGAPLPLFPKFLPGETEQSRRQHRQEEEEEEEDEERGEEGESKENQSVAPSGVETGPEEAGPGERDRKMLVCMEINSVKYQGVLFAQNQLT